MKLCTKSRYGVRAMFDIAYHSPDQPAQIKDISRRQAISPRYLEQIFQDFKKADLLQSRRGVGGGYSLKKRPEDITVQDMVMATEGKVCLVDCGDTCKLLDECVLHGFWVKATGIILGYFASVTLADLCQKGDLLGLERGEDLREG